MISLDSQHVAAVFRGGFSERRAGFPHAFAHDSLLRRDQCGAPLYDLDGQVIGLTIARVSRTYCPCTTRTA